jgi:Cu+-exporting ATPase
LSQAIYQSLPGEMPGEVLDFKEIPALGLQGRVGNNEIKAGSEFFVKGTEEEEKNYSSRVFVSVNGHGRGFITIRNEYRAGMENVIKGLKTKYGLHLLSGDNDAEKANLLPLFGDVDTLHFRQSPKEKLFYIEKLKSTGKKILMVGDGLNDAGALKESHVGITIADNVYHFSPACDGILDSDHFDKLPRFIAFSRIAMRIVIAGFIISFIYNIIGISFAAAGLLTPLLSAILMPLSSVTAVAFATFATIILSRNKF